MADDDIRAVVPVDEPPVAPLGFGRRNPHCSNCGDERGGPFGHEISECTYRHGMIASEVAALLSAERRGEFWATRIDRYFAAQGVDVDDHR